MATLVGTSGFDYKDWRGPFYPRFIKPADRLAFYAEHFDTVELNVTFYRMPAASAFRGWRDAVPDGFVFAVKASRYLTHVKRLADPQGSVEYLMERALLLGDRLGPTCCSSRRAWRSTWDASTGRSRRSVPTCALRSSHGTRAGSLRSCATCFVRTTRPSSWPIDGRDRSRHSGDLRPGPTCGCTRGGQLPGRATAGQHYVPGSNASPSAAPPTATPFSTTTIGLAQWRTR